MLMFESLIEIFEKKKLEKEFREVDRKLIEKQKREAKNVRRLLKKFSKRHAGKVEIKDYNDDFK